MDQTEGRPSLLSNRLSHTVTSRMVSGEEHVPFVFKWPTFPRFVAVDLLSMQRHSLTPELRTVSSKSSVEMLQGKRRRMSGVPLGTIP